MFTLRCEKYAPAPFPFIPASYYMVSAKSYYVRRQQLWNGMWGEPIPPNSVTSKEDGRWRTEVEVDDGSGNNFMIHVAEEEPTHRIYVMNERGKTVDTIT